MPDLFISVEQAEADLLACAAFIAERIKSADGHAEAMKSILPRFLARGEVDLAAELANAVDDPFSRDGLLTLVAEKCVEINDVDYAMQLTDAIEDDGVRTAAMERLGLILAGKGDTEKAGEIAASMAHPDFVYAGIAVRQTADGDKVASAETLERIAFPTARVSALQQIAANAVESDAESAIESLDQAVNDAIDIEHDEEKIRSLCEIGDLFIEARRNDKAIETFEKACRLAEILDNMHRDLFLSVCALGFLHAGSIELADRTLDLITDKTQMASALVGFARDQWKNSENDEAEETLDEAYLILSSQREAETHDSRARNAAMASIAAQFARFSKYERAIEAADKIWDIGDRTSALTQIAQIFAMQREDDLARQALDEIPDDANRLVALISVADAQEKIGDAQNSLATLNEAAELVETVPQLGARSSVLNELGIRFADHGQPERTRELAIANLAVISQIRDESSKAAALAGLSDLYSRVKIEPGDEEKNAMRALVAAVAW